MVSASVESLSRNMNVAQLQQEAEARLSDFRKFDVEFLEVIVFNMNHSNDNALRDASIKILQSLKAHKDAWQLVEPILKNTKTNETIFFALILMQEMITKNWRTLSEEDQNSILLFVKEITEKYIEMENNDSDEVLSKLNHITSEIAKKEYPFKWSSFIIDLCDPNKITSEYGIINNMRTIRYFIDDIFNYSDSKIHHMRLNDIKNALISQYPSVLTISEQILLKFTSKDIIKETISCLTVFNPYVPLENIMSTNIIPTICSSRYVTDRNYGSSILLFLAEMTKGVKITDAMAEKMFSIFIEVIKSIKTFLPKETDLNSNFDRMDELEKNFVTSLGKYIDLLFNNFPQIIYILDIHEYVIDALEYMTILSDMNDCQYYQHYSSFWADVVKTIKNKSEVYEPYKNVLNKIRYGIIQNMSKPEEVIIIEDEYHNIVREKLKDTNKIKIYHVMASTLQNLMIIDEETTTSIMVELLKKQTGTWAGSLDYDSDEDDCPKHGSNPNWTYREINSICWAIGSVSGIMNVEKESKFLVLALKELLNMNEVLDVQASKAVIASDVMYIIGQFPRFLSNNTKFCRTVMEKLFEFMNESFEGVKDMSCDTFSIIINKCGTLFATNSLLSMHEHDIESRPYLFTMINNTPYIIAALENHQKLSFYSSIGKVLFHFISRAKNNTEMYNETDPYDELIGSYVDEIVQAKNIISAGDSNSIRHIFLDDSNLKSLAFDISVLYTVGREAEFPEYQVNRVMGAFELFYIQIKDLLALEENRNEVRLVSGFLKTMKKELIRYMKELIETDVGYDDKRIALYEGFFLVIMKDYMSASGNLKDPEILLMIISFLKKPYSIKYVPTILDATLVCTLEMIQGNFKDYPDHRQHIFELILELVKRHFEILLEIPEKDFRLIIDAVIFSLNHILNDIIELGLDILKTIIEKIQFIEDKMQIFYRFFFFFILNHLLKIIANPAFKEYLETYSKILSMLVQPIKSGAIKISLDPSITDEEAFKYLKDELKSNSNTMVVEVEKMLSISIKENYPGLSSNDVEIFNKGLFTLSNSIQKLLQHIRDFAIDVQENRSQEYVDYYADKKIAEMNQAIQNNNSI